MGGRFPNAFALPGGTIVISDELVRLTNEDGELEAVLAHELGHLHRHHAMQTVLGSSYALLVVTALTGDLSTLSSFAGTVPFLLLQRGYSRRFEREADQDAIRLMERAGIPRRRFANILGKLQAARPASGVDLSYLSTHPAAAERLQALEDDPRP